MNRRFWLIPGALSITILFGGGMVLSGEQMCKEDEAQADDETEQLRTSFSNLQTQLANLSQTEQDFAYTLVRMQDDKGQAERDIVLAKLLIAADMFQQTVQSLCNVGAALGKGQMQWIASACQGGMKIGEGINALRSGYRCSTGDGLACLSVAATGAKITGGKISESTKKNLDKVAKQAAGGMIPSEVSKRVGKEVNLQNFGVVITDAGRATSFGEKVTKAVDGDPYAVFDAGKVACGVVGGKAGVACEVAVAGTRVLHNVVEYGKLDKEGEALAESSERGLEKARLRHEQIVAQEQEVRRQINELNGALFEVNFPGLATKNDGKAALRCELQEDKLLAELGENNESDQAASIIPSAGATSSVSDMLKGFRGALGAYRQQQNANDERKRVQREATTREAAKASQSQPARKCVVGAGENCTYKGKDFELDHSPYRGPVHSDSRPSAASRR